MISSRISPSKIPRTFGFTLLEMLVVLAISGVLIGIAALNLRPLSNDLQNDTNQMAGFVRQVRTRAMATTSAYRIVKLNNTRLRAQQSNSCDAASNTWISDDAFTLDLIEGVSITGISNNTILTCFSSRGLADRSRTVTLRDTEGKTRSAEIFMGGAVKVR